MAEKECLKCIHHPVCKTAESCDGYVSGCEHFVVISNLETTTFEQLIEIKRSISKDFRPWRVDLWFDNITFEGRLFIDTTYYKPSDLGWIDEPMSAYRKYGVYSSKEKAIAAAREYAPSYNIYCEGELL